MRRLCRCPLRLRRLGGGARINRSSTHGGFELRGKRRAISEDKAPGIAPAACRGGRIGEKTRADLHGCAPASRAPFPQIPAFEARCIRPGIVALPHRTAAGTSRSGASPEAAHRPSRCTASAGTEPWRPVSLRPPSCGDFAGAHFGFAASEVEREPTDRVHKALAKRSKRRKR